MDAGGGRDQKSGAVEVGSREEEQKEEDKTTVANTVIPNLPEDVITEILKRVPAEPVCNNLRYVCKSWFRTVTDNIVFQQEHLDHHHLVSKEPPTLLIHKNNRNKPTPKDMYHNPPLIFQTTTLVKLGDGQEAGFNDNHGVVDMSPVFHGLEIWGCCNGLMLASHVGHCNRYNSPLYYDSNLYVVNPVTKQQAKLPSCNCKIEKDMHKRAIFMFLPSTQQYKVMRIVVGDVDDKSLLLPPNRRSRNMYLEVLTFSAGVGTSSSHEDFRWRVIDAPDLHKVVHYPLPINGYVHFAEHGMGDVVSFDALDEKFYTTRIPDYDHRMHYHNKNDFVPKKHLKYMDTYRRESFLEMGGYLAYVRIRAHQYYPPWTSPLPPPQSSANQPQYQLDVWTLKDVEKGEWEKLYTSIVDTDFMAYDSKYYGYPTKYNCKGYHTVGEEAILSYGEDGETIIFINRREQALRVCNVKTNRSWNPLANDEKIYCQFIGYHFNTLSSFKSPGSN